MNESKPTCGWNESKPPIIHGREEYDAVVRAAEIRGATWALERVNELTLTCIGDEFDAARIVDERRKGERT